MTETLPIHQTTAPAHFYERLGAYGDLAGDCRRRPAGEQVAILQENRRTRRALVQAIDGWLAWLNVDDVT